MGDEFKILTDLIRYTTVRHGVIVSNIANVDTPNYKALDVKFNQALDDATLELKTTSLGHQRTAGSGSSPEMETEAGESWGDKNNVELDMEVAKMTENAMLFQAGVTMLTKSIGMFKNALRRQ
ncbi:MAG TPA: flagellar basal body rod protein FlgB [Thermodesulfovibrionales bacterium]|jgi:flagellar basal-body rod protein FlgB|nr:flagellar basal body rod protein FlgB [Thermodesulfovibrionales bacterium]